MLHQFDLNTLKVMRYDRPGHTDLRILRMEIGHGAYTIIHKIRPKIDNISYEISQSYFSVSQIGQNVFELFQIGAKKSLNLGSVSDRIEIGFRSALADLCVQVCDVVLDKDGWHSFIFLLVSLFPKRTIHLNAITAAPQHKLSQTHSQTSVNTSERSALTPDCQADKSSKYVMKSSETLHILPLCLDKPERCL